MTDKIRKNNDGSALMVAIVAGVVVMTFSLMLLMVSYSLFSTANGQQYDMSARELCQSIAEELSGEIAGVQFTSFDQMQASELSGTNRMWFYIRCNLWHSYFWPAINDNENYNAARYKYFKLNNAQGSVDEVEDITVKFSWEKPNSAGEIYSPVETQADTNGIYHGLDETKLYMTVMVTDKGVVYESTRSFSLYVNPTEYVPKEDEKEEDINLDGPTEGEEEWELNESGEENEEQKPKINPEEPYTINDALINPTKRGIFMYEKWSWTLE